MSRVFYLGAPPDIRHVGKDSVAERLRATGNNCGNLLIGHAISRHLKPELTRGNITRDAAFVNDNFDYILIGASNFLYSRFDFGPYAAFLEAVDLPCVIVGLGAQAPAYADRVSVPEGTERMVRIISERSTSLGVRGYFTAATLVDMGIHNVRVIGCPSMYWNGAPTLTIAYGRSGDTLAVAVNGSAEVAPHAEDMDAARALEARLARLSIENGYPYILQNELALMELAGGVRDSSHKSIPALRKIYGLDDVSADDFVRFARTNVRTYFDVEQWVAEMARFDLVIGSRFHGCLAALLAGVPAYVFVHDTRTREMCELLRVPHASVRNSGAIDVEAIYATLDLDALTTAYRYLYQNYVAFLEENDIEHCLPR